MDKLILHEHIGNDGTRICTSVHVEADALIVTVGDAREGVLSCEALVAILERYGKPLADGISLDGCPSLDLASMAGAGSGARLCILRHRALYDVIARDFVVLARNDHEPYAELATMVAAAVTHLARATALAVAAEEQESTD